MRAVNMLPTALALLLCGGPACAQQVTPQWWADLNIGSHHFGNDDEFLAEGERFNEFNPGVGLEVQWHPRHALAAGYFRNSVDENSLYALYQYTPLQLGRHVRIGAMAGAVTGYPGYNDGGIAPAGGLIAKLEGERVGVNLIVLPEIRNVTPTTLGLQFKVRLDR